MNWAKERDLLISQTMAFVQSVGGPKPVLEVRSKSHPEPMPATKAPTTKVEQVVPPVEILPVANPSPVARVVGMREEILSRVAAFRAHQQVFHRERDAYFHAVLDKARSGAITPGKSSGK